MSRPEEQQHGWMGDRTRGAQMGRESRTPENALTFADKMELRRVRLNVGGYDPGGAYWGHGKPLYYFTSSSSRVDGYLRAADREAAKAAVLKLYPNVWFYR